MRKLGRGVAPTKESAIMKNALLALFLVPLLTIPAFAGSLNIGNKPVVVAEAVEIGVGGVGIGVGNRHRHHDHHAVVLDRERHHHHDDHDSDRR
jgi:hypothetical protein